MLDRVSKDEVSDDASMEDNAVLLYQSIIEGHHKQKSKFLCFEVEVYYIHAGP